MFDPTKPYYRRDGKPAKIVYEFKDERFLVVLPDEDDFVIIKKDGHFCPGNDSRHDLINIPEMLDKTKPVQTRDGREVRNICWDYLLSRGEIGIAAIIRSKDGSRDYWQEWFSDGRVYPLTHLVSRDNDLVNIPVNIPEKVEGWQNIWKTTLGNYLGGEIHSTEDLAKAKSKLYSNWSWVACIKVSFTEGEGLK